MAMDTFEPENKNKLETYEWDDMWWDNSKEGDVRILIIGGSNSRGYRHILKKVTDGKWRIDNFATSKAIDNNYFKKALDLAISQQEEYDIILFNNGLHGWHLTTDEYGEHYIEMLRYLQTKNKRVAVILSTPWVDGKDYLVKERNMKAIQCAEEQGIPVIDVYSMLEARGDLYSKDGVHLTETGYTELAEYIYEHIKKFLGK